MKATDPDKDELLEDLMTDLERTSAPTIDGILTGVRREKHARTNRRVWAGTIALALLIGLIVSRQPEPEFQSVVAVVPATTTPAAPSVRSDRSDESAEESKWTVERIDDQELLELLADSPVALVKYPDGNRRLMMVVANTGR